MLDYEERYVLPSMAQWLGAPPVIPEDTETGLEATLSSVEEQLIQFKRVRQAQINMLPKLDQAAWNSIQRTTFWGNVSLYWLVTKTLQHTAEHTHNILSLVLFWDTSPKH